MRISALLSMPLALVLTAFVATVAVTGDVEASVITTDQYTEANAPTPTARVNRFLARDDVRAQLERFGVDPDDASARVATMTPEELAAIDRRIGDLPAGGDVVAVIGIVFIVLLVLELVGVTNIFTKF